MVFTHWNTVNVQYTFKVFGRKVRHECIFYWKVIYLPKGKLKHYFYICLKGIVLRKIRPRDVPVGSILWIYKSHHPPWINDWKRLGEGRGYSFSSQLADHLRHNFQHASVSKLDKRCTPLYLKRMKAPCSAFKRSFFFQAAKSPLDANVAAILIGRHQRDREKRTVPDGET